MKTLRTIAAIICIGISGATYSDTWVDGHYKRDGTYVPGHFRSSPNTTNWDNYTTQGNRNPYTGESGRRAPDYSSGSMKYGAGRSLQEGPRGGQYYYNDSGRKVYVPKR
jgi:hypothetical protein